MLDPAWVTAWSSPASNTLRRCRRAVWQGPGGAYILRQPGEPGRLPRWSAYGPRRGGLGRKPRDHSAADRG